MKRFALIPVALAALLALDPAVAGATSEGCPQVDCYHASDVQITVLPELPSCLGVDAEVEICECLSAIKVRNHCGDVLVAKDFQFADCACTDLASSGLAEEGVDRILLPIAGASDEGKTIDKVFTAGLGDKTFTIEVKYDVVLEPEVRDGDSGGCTMGSAASSGRGWLIAAVAALGLGIGRRLRARRRRS
jgi:hypothetical protein